MEEILKGNFNRNSAPSELRITDVRFTDIEHHKTLMNVMT